MSQDKIQSETRAIKIVDGYITVEIVERRKKPEDSKEKKNFLRLFKGKRG